MHRKSVLVSGGPCGGAVRLRAELRGPYRRASEGPVAGRTAGFRGYTRRHGDCARWRSAAGLPQLRQLRPRRRQARRSRPLRQDRQGPQGPRSVRMPHPGRDRQGMPHGSRVRPGRASCTWSTIRTGRPGTEPTARSTRAASCACAWMATNSSRPPCWPRESATPTD